MSLGSRIVIAVACAFSAVIFALMAVMGAIPKNGWIAWFFAAFCLAITLACIPGRHGRAISRIVGGFAFVTCIGYIVSEIIDPQPYKSESSPCLLNAIRLFVLWGIPAGYVMIFGIYPRWGDLGDEFGHDPDAADSDTEDYDDDEDDLPPSKDLYQR